MQQIKTKLIPVIHVLDEAQAMRNVGLCVDNGVDMVFLISHGRLDYVGLIKLAGLVRSKFPKMWIGLNMLDLSTREAISLSLSHVNGLWCDKTISSEDVTFFRKFNGQFFGSLAFKYQPQPTDLAAACAIAKATTDVATTSGPGTGKPASVEKITKLREMLGNHPLAIASGVDSENVKSYVGIANYLMVASSITDNDENIIEEKLVELKNKIEEYGE